MERLNNTLKDVKDLLSIGIRYIARDSNGRLYGYTHEPFKAYYFWQVEEGSLIELVDFRGEFQEITFRDNKPTKIEEII